MGLISSLKRCEEGATPSRPLLFTTTAAPAMADTLMPAIKVAVWVPTFPMRILLDSPAKPALPIAILLLPVVRAEPALAPKAMLLLPVVLFWSALTPLAVLPLPVPFLTSASKPSAVLLPPVVLYKSAFIPLAVL